MYYINKITSSSVVDYAAEELKKYLRMMMPEGGDVVIKYAPDAVDGFRLGVMSDFGLDTSDVADVELDDIIYVDTDACGGIIAGSNPRSVLLSVYDYLRENGCRWLLPGVDGEFIPMKDIIPVKRRFVPTNRYRGWVSEGTEYQQSMIEAVEFAPKLGLNVFMIEFRFPKSYYERYYNHVNNTANRAPEPVAVNTIIQWKRQLEAEIAKRGLQYHDMGHGFTYEPLGIDAMDGWNTEYDSRVTPEMRELLAMIGGERKIVYYPINTNLCMSNPKARAKVVSYVIDYAKKHSNVDYLHVWLADANNNHCECEKCVVKRPADWYTVLLNEIDDALTAENMSTRIVFISYMDTAWAPLVERIKNPDRFALMVAPITRSYTETYDKNAVCTVKPYERNKLKMPGSLEEFFALFGEWKKMWPGKNLAFEYHFWRQMWLDISGINLAKKINDDVRLYSDNGIDGILEDGSQRAFFPTGLAMYTYGRSLYDQTLTYEEIAEDYFSTAFGDAWREFYAYLEELTDAFDYLYMTSQKSADLRVSKLYNPEMAERFARVPEITAKGLRLIKEHYDSDYRLRTVSVRLLEYHAEYANLLADALIPKALGDDALANERLEHLSERMGRHEVAIEQYYDHCLAINALKAKIFNAKSNAYMDIEDKKKK